MSLLLVVEAGQRLIVAPPPPASSPTSRPFAATTMRTVSGSLALGTAAPGVVGLVSHRVAEESQVSGRPDPRLGQRHRGVKHPTGIQTAASHRPRGIVNVEQSAPVIGVNPTDTGATSRTTGVIAVIKAQFAGDRRRRRHWWHVWQRRHLGHGANEGRTDHGGIVCRPHLHGGVVGTGGRRAITPRCSRLAVRWQRGSRSLSPSSGTRT